MKMKAVLAGALVAGLAAVGSIAPAQATTAAEARLGYAAVYLASKSFNKSRSGLVYGMAQAGIPGALGTAGGWGGKRFGRSIARNFAARTTVRISARFAVTTGARIGASVGSVGGPVGMLAGIALGAA